MSKPKKPKKRDFSYLLTSQTPVKPVDTPQPSQPADTLEFNYVGRDVKRILILAVGLVLLQLVLWYLFEHTGLGPAVYRLIKL